MTRFPELPPHAEMASVQRRAYDAIEGARGTVSGPFRVLLHQPAVAAGAHQIGAHLRFHSQLQPDVRECAILATVRMLDCNFEWHSHVPAALAAGVDDRTIEAIRSMDFHAVSGDPGLAVEIAGLLIEEHAVPPDVFDRASRAWNVAEVIDLVCLVGYYAFLSIVLNAFDVPSSAEVNDPLPRNTA